MTIGIRNEDALRDRYDYLFTRRDPASPYYERAGGERDEDAEYERWKVEGNGST